MLRVTKGEKEIDTYEKFGVNNTTWVDKSAFSSQDDATLYSWKGKGVVDGTATYG